MKKFIFLITLLLLPSLIFASDFSRFLRNAAQQSQATNNSNSGFNWVWSSSNQSNQPQNMINAAISGTANVYICHANYNNLGVHPGTLTKNGCLISYAGSAYVENNFQVLTGFRSITWRNANVLNQFLQNPASFQNTAPIIGGNEQGHNLYVCRTYMNNRIHVGKIVGNNCNIGWHGQELLQSNYQVLFVN